MKRKVLLVVTLPPPLHGTSMMNSYVHEILGKMGDVEVRMVRLQYAKDVSEMGRFSPGKVLTTFKICCRLVIEGLFFRPAFFYFPIAPIGKAFYRDMAFGLILKLLAIPGLYHMHAKGLKSYEKRSMVAALLRFVFRRSRIICLSPRLFYDVEPYCSDNRLIALPNGIKPTLSRALRGVESENANERVRILFLAHLWFTKGFLDLLQAGLLLEEKGVSFEMHFVGGWGGEREQTQFMELWDRFVERDRIVYHGPLYDEDKKRLLRDSDIMAFPTMNDAFPLALVEAMEFSLPVVATPEGAILDIVVDGESGFIVERSNPMMLAERLEQLIRNPALRARMGNFGRQRFLERLTFARYEKDVLRIFGDALHAEQFFRGPVVMANDSQAKQTAVATSDK